MTPKRGQTPPNSLVSQSSRDSFPFAKCRAGHKPLVIRGLALNETGKVRGTHKSLAPARRIGNRVEQIGYAGRVTLGRHPAFAAGN